MMKLMLACAGLSLLTVGATAQTRYGPPPPGPRLPGIFGPTSTAPAPTIAREVGDLRDRIHDGRSSGTLSRKDSRRLRREASQIGTLSDRYGSDGLSASERAELDTRVLILRDIITAKRTRGQDKTR